MGEGEEFRVRQAQRVNYGEKGLQRSISDVLNTVFDHYQYTSLAEFNALLGLYRVRADRGRENSRLYQTRGLIYHALDENGKAIGSYIKASSFLLRPTLARLEEKFALNASLVLDNQRRVKTAIDWTLAGTPPDWDGFREALGREGIDVVVQVGKTGDAKDIFFVDHEVKAVFRGVGLGEGYVLEAIRLRCALERRQEEELERVQRLRL